MDVNELFVLVLVDLQGLHEVREALGVFGELGKQWHLFIFVNRLSHNLCVLELSQWHWGIAYNHLGQMR